MSEINYTVRMPAALRDALRERAWEERRSCNSEILAGLWAHVGRPEEAAAVRATCHKGPLPVNSGVKGR